MSQIESPNGDNCRIIIKILAILNCRFYHDNMTWLCILKPSVTKVSIKVRDMHYLNLHLKQIFIPEIAVSSIKSQLTRTKPTKHNIIVIATQCSENNFPTPGVSTIFRFQVSFVKFSEPCSIISEDKINHQTIISNCLKYSGGILKKKIGKHKGMVLYLHPRHEVQEYSNVKQR